MELSTKVQLIKMDEVAKIFNFTHTFKKFIEGKCKSILASRRAYHSILREGKLLSLRVQQQEKT